MIYKPSDDTFLLAEYINDMKGNKALDVCTGSGYIADILSRNFKQVIAIDIDINALENAIKRDNISYICCSGASAINTKFDLITMNPPYLPSDRIDDIAIDGGKEGMEVTLPIIEDCLNLMHKDSKMLVVSSSLANISRLDRFNAKIVRRKRIGFEEIMIVEIRP